MLKFVSFKTVHDSAARVGALLPNSAVLDLAKFAAAKTMNAPPVLALQSMVDFISAGDDAAKWAASAIKNVADSSSTSAFVIGAKDATLVAPLAPRRNIMCVGKNYKDHVAEVASADKIRGIGTSSDPKADPAAMYPKYPQFFSKATTTVVGPNDNVESHANISKWMDYEAELAVVIGKSGRDIPREKAMEHVFG